VALHFRIAPEMHINSHTPKDEFLIPTVFSIPMARACGCWRRTIRRHGFHATARSQNKLSVYTGEFTIQARLAAEPGDHLVEARLRFQACDKSQCLRRRRFPWRSM